jgi:hypothetical protein
VSNQLVLNSQNIDFDFTTSRYAVALAFGLAALLCGVPAAAQDAAPAPPSSSTNLSGYMDFHYNNVRNEDAQIDFHRFVLLVAHRFTDKIRFVSELELEHAFVEGLEESGELELEQAYVDFLLSRSFNVRAGMLLMPVGIINERHEPPVFYGVERPLVETIIIPTTWFEVGAGLHGEVGRGWRYRAYVTAPLDAAEFSAEEGVREGRQKGNRANIRRAAGTGRLEYVGIRGLTAGASVWAGDSGFTFQPRLDLPVRLYEADVRYARDRFEGRAELARVNIPEAAALNDAITRTTGVNPNIARALRGGYLEAGYRIVSGARFGDIGAFVRYETVDTQFRMPAGYVPLAAFDRDVWVVGGTYWPEPDIAIKVDYVHQRNRSTVIAAPSSFNVGLGWWF